MPSGFRVDTDNWLKEYEEAKQLAQEALQLIQDRNVNNAAGGPEASRKTATARRKIGTLGTQIEKLLRMLDAPELQTLSESEKARRRDLLYDLKTRREQMQGALKRSTPVNDRDALFAGAGSQQQQGGAGPSSRDSDRTAELDAGGLLVLQRQMMQEQDQALEGMEKTVISTKHIALAIGEEVDLQTRLLDDLDDDVEVTQSRMKAATAKVKHVLKNSSNWRGGLCIFVLIVTLVVIFLLSTKLANLFGH